MQEKIMITILHEPHTDGRPILEYVGQNPKQQALLVSHLQGNSAVTILPVEEGSFALRVVVAGMTDRRALREFGVAALRVSGVWPSSGPTPWGYLV